MERDKDTLYTYYQVDLESFPLDWDYTICESLDEVRDLLEYLDSYLDDSEGEGKVIIQGIGMTAGAYEEFKESGIKYTTYKPKPTQP